MDPKLVAMLADYMEKTGSVSAETRDLVERMYRHIEKQDSVKTASVAILNDRAGAIAQKLASTRLPSGSPLIDGYEEIKQASAMLSKHDEALNLVSMVLDAVQQDRTKVASLEPGRPVDSSKRTLTAKEQLYADCGV